MHQPDAAAAAAGRFSGLLGAAACVCMQQQLVLLNTPVTVTQRRAWQGHCLQLTLFIRTFLRSIHRGWHASANSLLRIHSFPLALFLTSLQAQRPLPTAAAQRLFVTPALRAHCR
jgi:hypothetical protein